MKKLTIKGASIYALVSGLTILLINHLVYTMAGSSLVWAAIIFVYVLGIAVYSFWLELHSNLLTNLKDMTDDFAQGSLQPRVFITTDDEIGQLNEALRNMAEKLNQYIQKALRDKDQMETILVSMVEGVLAFDMVGRLMLMNKTAEDMIGVSWEEANNHYFLEILRNHQLADLLRRGLTEGKRQVMELRLSPTDPEFYRVYITPIIGKNGQSQGAIMVLRNVTKVRNLERMRTEFVANVSHELRTPLTSIKGYVETLLDGAIDNKEVALKFLNILNNEADRLNRLISDLFYLSQLETGRMEIAKKKIDTAQFLDKVIHLLHPLAQSKKIEIISIIHPQVQTFFANQDMMEQVLINLLDNAIKYSHEGSQITIEIAPDEEGTMIKIIDKGIGIPAESLPRLFERFYRVDKARSRQVGGTGLGLSIVKHVIERHRGQVQVESEEDRGTTFTIILPQG